jgi:Tol biopolymer transport system component
MFESSRILSGAGCVIVAGLLATSPLAERAVAVAPVASAPRIAFASERDGNWEIYAMDVDGGHQTRLTRRDPQDRFPLWSPDRS